MDRLYQNRADSRAVGAVDIRENLISHKQCVFLIRSHLFHRFSVIRRIRLSCLVDIRNLHRVIEHFHTRFLIVRQQHAMISQLLQMCKKRARPLVRRRAVRHQRIINIKNNASISLLIKAVKIDRIGRIYVFSRVKPSFFEMTVAMAFKYFADSQVDIAVIEVGLGGRLDSTNIITPLASVITNISFDHMALLGNTLEKIASEKAGIIKPGIPVVIGTRDKTYDFVFEQKAQTCETPIEFASDNWTTTINIDGSFQLTRKNGWHFDHLTSELKGLYQRKNIPTVLETIPVLQQAGLKISDQQVRQGIERVVTNTGLFGRWQTLSNQPLTICDTGHNIDGLTEITQQLKQCRYRKLHFVIGMVSDKDIDSVLHILPQDAVYYFCKASIPRAMPEQQLAQKARQAGLQGEYYPTVAAAYEAARQAASSEDMIYIGGSTFVVAEVI